MFCGLLQLGWPSICILTMVVRRRELCFSHTVFINICTQLPAKLLSAIFFYRLADCGCRRDLWSVDSKKFAFATTRTR